MQLTRLKNFMLFLQETWRDPAGVGAVAPSSKHLANKIIDNIKYQENSLVVELGAGTGAITRALRDSKVPKNNLIIIERSKDFYNYLCKDFPDLHIVNDDAMNLAKILQDRKLPLSNIISGIPLRALPKAAVEDLAVMVRHLLDKNGLFIQFTYDLRKNFANYLPGFRCIKSQYVWFNFPPAKIEVYTIDN